MRHVSWWSISILFCIAGMFGGCGSSCCDPDRDLGERCVRDGDCKEELICNQLAARCQEDCRNKPFCQVVDNRCVCPSPPQQSDIGGFCNNPVGCKAPYVCNLQAKRCQQACPPD